MIPCHSAALRCTWPFAVTCMTPSSIENEIAHLTVAAFSSHLSRLRREERLVMTAYVGEPIPPRFFNFRRSLSHLVFVLLRHCLRKAPPWLLYLAFRSLSPL